MDSNQRIVAERLDAISSYITTRGLPTPVGRRLRRYFRHFYSQKTAIDEREILGDLSTTLRQEVSSFLVSGLMTQVTVERGAAPSAATRRPPWVAGWPRGSCSLFNHSAPSVSCSALAARARHGNSPHSPPPPLPLLTIGCRVSRCPYFRP